MLDPALISEIMFLKITFLISVASLRGAPVYRMARVLMMGKEMHQTVYLCITCYHQQLCSVFEYRFFKA